jgi:hypothetical protein
VSQVLPSAQTTVVSNRCDIDDRLGKELILHPISIEIGKFSTSFTVQLLFFYNKTVT